MSGMGLSLSELCCLFCCPPFPSKIAAKLAFLPPEPTYSLEDSTSDSSDGGSNPKLVLNDKAEWQYSQREQESLEVFYTRTNRGNRIACMFVRCSPNARYTNLSTKKCIHHSNNTRYSQILIIAQTLKALDLLLKQSIYGIVIFLHKKTPKRGEHSRDQGIISLEAIFSANLLRFSDTILHAGIFDNFQIKHEIFVISLRN